MRKRKKLTEGEVVVRLQSQIRQAGTETAFARLHDISTSYVNAVVCGHASPGPAILNALGLKRVILYEQSVTTPPNK